MMQILLKGEGGNIPSPQADSYLVADFGIGGNVRITEAIADAADRLDDVGVFAKLAAEGANVHVDGPFHASRAPRQEKRPGRSLVLSVRAPWASPQGPPPAIPYRAVLPATAF